MAGGRLSGQAAAIPCSTNSSPCNCPALPLLPPPPPGRSVDIPRFRQLLRSLVPDLPIHSAAALVCVVDHTNWARRTTDNSRTGT